MAAEGEEQIAISVVDRDRRAGRRQPRGCRADPYREGWRRQSWCRRGRTFLGTEQETRGTLRFHNWRCKSFLATCPGLSGVVSRGGLSALHTSEVLAARPRAIATIFVLIFIFCSFG